MNPDLVNAAAALAHLRWSTLPRTDDTAASDRKDYSVHDRDFDDPDPDVYDRLYQEALAELQQRA